MPHQTACCGQIISAAAVSRLETKECPFCKKEEFKTTPDKHFQRQVHELQVFCSHRGRGCEWTGEVASFNTHVKSCPKKNSPLLQEIGDVPLRAFVTSHCVIIIAGVGVLTMDNAVVIMDHLHPLANFSYQLGMALNLPKEVVEKIHAEHKKSLDRLQHIIEAFLSSRRPLPTWIAIIQALQTPGLNRSTLAEEIQRNFSTVDTIAGRC